MGVASSFVQCNDSIHNMHHMHLAGLDLNLALVLHALLTERSVSKAAKRLGLSQPATSHALARLRHVLSDPVVVRVPGGIAPTPRAEAIAAPLASAMALLERSLLSAPQFDPATAARRFLLGASDYAGFVLLPGLVARVAESAPGIDLWLRPMGEAPDNQLGLGDFEIALNVVRPGSRGAGIREQRLFDERFVCIVREGHPLTKGKLTVKRFAEARHAFIAPRGHPGGVVEDALARLGLERRIALAVPHFLVAPHIIARTDLVLTVAERIARAHAAVLPLRILEPPLELGGFTIGMTWHERNHQDPGLAWLRAGLAEVASSIGDPAKSPQGRSRVQKRGTRSGSSTRVHTRV